MQKNYCQYYMQHKNRYCLNYPKTEEIYCHIHLKIVNLESNSDEPQ